MLEKISIKNYRCYDDHEIEFKDMTIVVGKNNAGKSTLVEALRVVSLALRRFKTLSYRNPPEWIDLPSKAKGIFLSWKTLGFTTENLFHLYGEPYSELSAVFSNSISTKIFIGENEEVFCTLIDHNGQYINSKTEAIQIGIPQINILPQITPIEKEERTLNRDYVMQNLSTDLSSRHFRNQLELMFENYPKFKELSEQSWPSLRIHSFARVEDSNAGNVRLTLMVQDGSFVSEIGWVGSGLQMWLQIMWFLSRVDENEVVILDEPDVYMHPELQRKLIRLLRYKYKQVIVSTHSIEIISEVEASNILIIDKNKRKSLFANKVPVVQRILNSIGSIHNLQLTKLWASRKLVIVEGDDIEVLKRIQNILFPFSNEPFDSIPNFDIGGWGGWNNAKGSSMLLKETVDGDVQIYCIFDSDYHTEAEIEKRILEANSLNVNIHIWQKKEIENYLIVPSLILRIIKKEGKKAQALTHSEIESIIKQKCLEMQDNLIDCIADGIQKADRKLSISNARTTAKKKIDFLENRISGKDLISALSKWSQDNYKISLSPIKLAANMQAGEVVEELKNVITAIEKNQNF